MLAICVQTRAHKNEPVLVAGDDRGGTLKLSRLTRSGIGIVDCDIHQKETIRFQHNSIDRAEAAFSTRHSAAHRSIVEGDLKRDTGPYGPFDEIIFVTHGE